MVTSDGTGAPDRKAHCIQKITERRGLLLCTAALFSVVNVAQRNKKEGPLFTFRIASHHYSNFLKNVIFLYIPYL
jgi:hypothetical protein